MAKLTGLMVRGGVYHLRVMVPLDLRAAHEGRIKIIKTLNTSSRQEATLKGAILRAQWLTRFDSLRKTPGEPVEAFVSHAAPLPLASPAKASTARTLRQVFNRWQQIGDRSKDSIRACERALNVFESSEGSPSVQDIAYEHGVRFRTALIAKGLSQKTTQDYFIWVQSLLRFAESDMGIIPRNPWARLVVEGSCRQRGQRDGR